MNYKTEQQSKLALFRFANGEKAHYTIINITIATRISSFISQKCLISSIETR